MSQLHPIFQEIFDDFGFPKARQAAAPIDGRDPDPTKEGIFRNHNCWKCNDGEKPCATQKPGREYLCEHPHARND